MSEKSQKAFQNGHKICLPSQPVIPPAVPVSPLPIIEKFKDLVPYIRVCRHTEAVVMAKTHT